MKLAVLHDHCESRWADKNGLVFQRITVHQQEIGKRACANDAKLPFKTHEITADGGWRGGKLVPLKGYPGVVWQRPTRRRSR